MKILHVFRTPVGGLFRHVKDLATEQAARGHEVSAIYDNSTGDALTSQRLESLRSVCRLGVHAIPMSRTLSHRDVSGLVATRRLVRNLGIDILHGHGAKGGAFARLAVGLGGRRPNGPRVFYTPHGGSLHYEPGSTAGRVYLGLERLLERWTDGLIFESAYSAGAYGNKVGSPQVPIRLVPNGLQPADFEPSTPSADACDVLFVGELRHLKGVDVLLRALANLNAERPVTATIVGAGPDAAELHNLARTLGLSARVRFPGALPAREAFGLGRILVVPSRAESFPYIVLEGGAAGLPMIATDVGGIPEILGNTGATLIAPGDVAALTQALRTTLTEPDRVRDTADAVRDSIAHRFTVLRMTDAVMGFYGAPVRARAMLQSAQSGAR